MKCKKVIMVILFLAVLVTLSVFSIIQYRSFFQFNNSVFTVWNTRNGCYIILGHYKRPKLPQKNYIRTDSRVELELVIDSDNVFHIFSNECYSLGFEPEVSFDEIKYIVYPFESRNENTEKIAIFSENYINGVFSYEALDNWGFVREKNEKEKVEVLRSNTFCVLQRFILGLFFFERDEPTVFP